MLVEQQNSGFVADPTKQPTSADKVGSHAQQSSARTATPGDIAHTGRGRHRGQVERPAVERAAIEIKYGQLLDGAGLALNCCFNSWLLV